MSEQVTDGSQTEKILAEKIETIPSLPDVTDNVLKLLRDENTSFDQIDKVVRTDPSLVGKILQVANKRYYGHEGKVTSLKKAMQLMGFNTLRSIVIAQGMDHEYSAPEIPEFPREGFWEYSMATGIAGEIIGDYLGLDSDKKGELFSAGHLHAVGRIILDQHLHREFVKVVESVSGEDMNMIQAEEEILGTTHCNIGSAVLEEWNLPTPIVKAARYYYQPDECPDNSVQKTVDITHLSSVLTKTKGYGSSGDQDLSYLQEDRVQELGLSDEDVKVILNERFPEQYERFQ
jgi:HD-like signal output (HDOD) protein